MALWTGVGVSVGRASGPVARVAEALPEPGAGPAPQDPAAESARVRPAADAVAEQLFRQAGSASGDAKAVLETTAAMAFDPALISRAEQLVTERSVPADRAAYEAAEEFAVALRKTGGYMAERVRDVQDVRDRIIAELQGIQPPGVPELDRPSVLLARDLAPADTAGLNPELVLALVTEEGGPTSHTAILARSLGIPSVVSVRGLMDDARAIGAIVDGSQGTIEMLDQAVTTQASEVPGGGVFHGPGGTSDGHAVSVLANVGSATDAVNAVHAGAEGVGLFRTEFCYLAAEEEPSVATQRRAYAEVLAPFSGKPVVVRTLDAGADKPLSFVDHGEEPNPALGVRGLRVSFARPELLDQQLESIAAAEQDAGARVSVMAPMVATAEEAAWFAERVRAAGIRRSGVMIEVPAAAFCAREILDTVDFVSVGTNDLAQYLFAADRELGALAGLNDPWQPALLRLLQLVGNAGSELDKPVGVCGEAASDPLLGGVLVGLGVSSLSAAGAAVPTVGTALAGYSLASCRQAAAEALTATDPAGAREAARLVLG